MLETHTALQEAQWQGMKLWLEEKEKQRDMYHQDDLLWGKGITDIVERVVAATKMDQKEVRKTGTEGAGLEASRHTDLKQTGVPEEPVEHQQLQAGTKLKSMTMLRRKRNPTPEQNVAPTSRTMPTPMTRAILAPKVATTTAPTPTRQWQTVPPRNQKKSASPAAIPTTGSSMVDRHLILMRDESMSLPNTVHQEIMSAINRVLFHRQVAAQFTMMNARRNAKGTITAITHQNSTAEIALRYRDSIIMAARTVE